MIDQRYELVERIGSGGMGEVWRARDHRLARDVAVKLLSPALVADPDNLVRFFSEAQSVARIQSSNVVTVLDFGQTEDRPYLVMELVSGGPLTGLMGAPMLPERAVEIIEAVAGAAGTAHRLGIVHRDIKPANILLDGSGNPKLCDFGIASSAHAVERVTATGVAMGSPHYIAPEQASGGPATPATDVYALGVVLYEMLTGVKPFDGDNPTAIVIAHVEQTPAPPSIHVEELPPALDALVLRCLAKDPGERFAGGDGLRDAIWHLDGEPTAVLAPPRVHRRSAKRAAMIGVALLLLASAVALREVLPGGSGPERAGATTASGEDRSRDPDRRDGAREDDAAPSAEVTPGTPGPTVTPDDDDDGAEDEPADEGPARPDDEEAPDEEPEPTPEPSASPTAAPTDGGSEDGGTAPEASEG